MLLAILMRTLYEPNSGTHDLIHELRCCFTFSLDSHWPSLKSWCRNCVPIVDVFSDTTNASSKRHALLRSANFIISMYGMLYFVNNLMLYGTNIYFVPFLLNRR